MVKAIASVDNPRRGAVKGCGKAIDEDRLRIVAQRERRAVEDDLGDLSRRHNVVVDTHVINAAIEAFPGSTMATDEPVLCRAGRGGLSVTPGCNLDGIKVEGCRVAIGAIFLERRRHMLPLPVGQNTGRIEVPAPPCCEANPVLVPTKAPSLSAMSSKHTLNAICAIRANPRHDCQIAGQVVEHCRMSEIDFIVAAIEARRCAGKRPGTIATQYRTRTRHGLIGSI